MKKLFSLLVALTMLLCSTALMEAVPAPTLFTPGTYQAEAQGFGGKVQVVITVTENEIVDVTITGANETPALGGVAVETLGAAIVKAQTPNVDAVAGATVTSSAIIAAATEALLQAGADISVLDEFRRDTAEDIAREEKTLDTQVVIIGAGGAGMTAAIMLHQAGVDFVILEKMPYVGGNTTKATGGMNAAETHYQKEQGIEDSVELFAQDTMKGGHDINDPDLVKTLAENSSAAIDWLDSIGAPLANVGQAGGASTKRQHRPVNDEGKILSVGNYLVEHLSGTVAEQGIEVIYGAQVDEILMEGGKAVGLHATTKDGGLTVKANSVVITTGGFGSNPELIVKYRPELEGYVSTNAPTITGDAIALFEAVGADFVDLDQIQIHPTVVQADGSLITESLRGDGAILINSEGKRFGNEILTRDVVSASVIEQDGGYAWLIVDQTMYDGSTVIAGYLDKGLMTKAETTEDLAALMEVDAATLQETLDTWKAAVAAGKDEEFGRENFDALLTDLSNPPYYAVKIAPGIHHCMGGVKINTNAEVVGTDGSVIPGLYAAGEVAGGVHGGNRLGGNAVADIIVFGRIAGESASK